MCEYIYIGINSSCTYNIIINLIYFELQRCNNAFNLFYVYYYLNYTNKYQTKLVELILAKNAL